MTQPRALFLADVLEDTGNNVNDAAAAELRRLHAELERCKQVCAATSEGWRTDAALAEPVQHLVDPAEYDDFGAAERYNRGLK